MDPNLIPDAAIPCAKAPNPILDLKAETRLAKAEALYTPSLPLATVKRAQEAATSTGVTLLLLVGLAAKLTHNPTVRLKPSLLKLAGLSDYQARRAAAELDKAGLVSVISTKGKRREIVVTDAELLQWLDRKSGR